MLVRSLHAERSAVHVSKRPNGTRGQWCRTTTRLALYARDGFACVYCQAEADSGVVLTLDHVTALELGGTNAVSNLVTCCFTCNSRKQDRTTRRWFALLRDEGVDTSLVAVRVRRACARRIDRAEGRKLAAARKEG